MRAILFDAGGVLLKNRLEELDSALVRDIQASVAKTVRKIRKELGPALLLGKRSTNDFLTKVREELSKRIGEKHYRKVYLKTMKTNKELLSIVKYLKKHYRVGLLSNTSNLHAQINRERGLYAHFDPLLISCEIGHVKPQRGVFELVLKKLALPAQECVFIDDRPEHLEIPRSMGFHVVHFQNNAQLLRALARTGICI